jgi:radical SAM superfamily enzyme YgiQ (UPF0313 family)
VRALLVSPGYPETYWSFSSVLKFISRKAVLPPVGLLTVAAMMPHEWDKKLVDVGIYTLEDEDILWADMVFVSAMFVQRESALEVIERCRKLGRKVVAGGPLFTIGDEDFSQIDHLLPFETENTFPEFLHDLEAGCAKPVYLPEKRPAITGTPVPLWSLINLKDYATMAVQFSRGCPFNCEFCDIAAIYGRRIRTKTPEQVLREFDALYEAGWRDSVFLVDDNFIGNKIRVKELLPELIRWQEEHRYPVKLLTQASLNLADDPELMEMMSRANFYKVFLGIESPSADSLKECGKLQNTARDMAASIRVIQKNGMQVMGGFIVGFDSDTESIFETQLDFIQRIGVANAMVTILTALPRTQLWHRIKEEGRLLHHSTANSDGSCNFIPRMGRRTLMDGFRKLVNSMYEPRRYYERIAIFLDNYNPTARGTLRKGDITALLRGMWGIGVLSRSRRHFWRLMLKVIREKPKALPAAMELAMFGVHFQHYAKAVAATPLPEEDLLEEQSDSTAAQI